jgi:hypothetical protein
MSKFNEDDYEDKYTSNIDNNDEYENSSDDEIDEYTISNDEEYTQKTAIALRDSFLDYVQNGSYPLCQKLSISDVETFLEWLLTHG